MLIEASFFTLLKPCMDRFIIVEFTFDFLAAALGDRAYDYESFLI